MNTFIFLWNSNTWNWRTQAQDVNKFHKDGFLNMSWSCFAHQQVTNLLNQGTVPNALLFRSGRGEEQGLIGWGRIEQLPFEAAHFDAEQAAAHHTRWYTEIRFEMISVDPIISRSQLVAIAPDTFEVLPAQSGRQIKSSIDNEAIWEYIGKHHYQAQV